MRLLIPRLDSDDWCYYFQKAELAEQFHDWGRIVQLGDEARSKGLLPEDTTEWRPFIKGYKKMDNPKRENVAGRTQRKSQ